MNELPSISKDMVSWDIAQKVATKISKGSKDIPLVRFQTLEDDFKELTSLAENLVGEETGLYSLLGPARAKVATRPDWVNANIASFQRLIGTISSKFEDHIKPGIGLNVSKSVAGVQVGVILGWMSTRVLGQYDLLLVEDDKPEDQDIVYYVGPNVLELEEKFALPPRQFRLWLALHEVTHRAQFTAVSWMRDHFRSLVQEGISGLAPDPNQFAAILKRLTNEIRSGKNPFADSGILGVVASNEQIEVLKKIQALMSLLEGHGDITMDRAGKEHLPEAARFSRILRQRRNQAKGVQKIMQQLLGLEAKMRQYAEGEKFIEKAELLTHPGILSYAWQGPENLPTLDEISNPKLWIERVVDRSLVQTTT